MSMTPHPVRSQAVVSLLAVCLATAPLGVGQSAPKPATPAEGGEEAIKLKEFVVTDKWYLARAVSKEEVFQGGDRIIKFRATRIF